MEDKIIIDNDLYEKRHKRPMYGSGGIAIRHQPDGELFAYLKSPRFDKEDVLELISKVLDGSENFSIEHVFTGSGHVSFKNELIVYPNNIPKPQEADEIYKAHEKRLEKKKNEK